MYKPIVGVALSANGHRYVAVMWCPKCAENDHRSLTLAGWPVGAGTTPCDGRMGHTSTLSPLGFGTITPSTILILHICVLQTHYMILDGKKYQRTFDA